VCYLEERPARYEGPFLREERHLINAIARHLGQAVERTATGEKLRLMAMVAQQAAEGIAVAGTDGILQFVNAAWARMHGYDTGDELVGRPLSVFHTEEQMAEDVVPFNEQVVRNGQHRGEVGHVTRDGIPFVTTMTVALLKDPQGKPIGLGALMADITERKRAERDLERYAASLEQANEDLRRFTYTVSHDLRGPLVNLKGFAGELRAAHAAAMAQCEAQTKVVLDEPADIVVTSGGGYPLDLTLYQSTKGIVAAGLICRDGGTIIIAQQNAEGLGSEHFAGLITQADVHACIRAALAGEGYCIDTWQLHVVEKVLRRCRVISVSELPEADQRRVPFERADTVEEALARALKDHGAGARIVVVPEGPYVLGCLTSDPVGRMTVPQMLAPS